jgi:hypothetical protein
MLFHSRLGGNTPEVELTLGAGHWTGDVVRLRGAQTFVKTRFVRIIRVRRRS